MDLDMNNKNLKDEFENLNKDDPDFSKKCSKLIKDINEGLCTILQLTEQLKGLLVDPVPVNREIGVHVLTMVLEEISHERISVAQINVMCDFYADKLKDHHQIIPATLRGILALLSFNNVPDGQLRKLLDSLFKNVPCQQQQQHDRLNIYKILKKSLENSAAELLEMDMDFVYGVMSAVDGERDPRNLLFLFHWLPIFLRQCNLGHLREEMFEVLACYFPIDFRTPPQDSNSISRSTLASSLSDCLCATPDFAEYCLPLALEKLSSSLHIAKFDSLDILAKGCDIFAVSFYIQHSTDIWSQIQREVLNNNDEELEKMALQTLVTVMRKLSDNPDSIYKPILSDIVDTLKGNLLPNMKLFVPSCKMLHHLCKSSKTAASFVIGEIVPIMINTFHITSTATHQVLLLKKLICFVWIYTEVYQKFEVTENQHLSAVLYLCLKACLHNDDELRVAGFYCISTIIKSLPDDIRKCFYENIRPLLIQEQPNHLRFALWESFKGLAEMHPSEIQNCVLDQIQIKNNDELYWYLQSLSTIIPIETFTQDTLGTYFKYCQSDFETSLVAIHCLRQTLEQYSDVARIQYYVEELQIVCILVDLILRHVDIIDICNIIHKRLLCDISTISKLIVRHQSCKAQILYITKCEEVISVYRNCQSVGLVIIIDGLISCLHKDIKLPSNIVPDLLSVALGSDHDFIVTIANQLLANLLNKNLDDEKLENDLQFIENYLCKNWNANRLDRSVTVLSWTTKALLMRNHSKGAKWTEKLIELLDTHKEAAKGFEIIMKDKCPSLSEESSL